MLLVGSHQRASILVQSIVKGGELFFVCLFYVGFWFFVFFFFCIRKVFLPLLSFDYSYKQFSKIVIRVYQKFSISNWWISKLPHIRCSLFPQIEGDSENGENVSSLPISSQECLLLIPLPASGRLMIWGKWDIKCLLESPFQTSFLKWSNDQALYLTPYHFFFFFWRFPLCVLICVQGDWGGL